MKLIVSRSTRQSAKPRRFAMLVAVAKAMEAAR